MGEFWMKTGQTQQQTPYKSKFLTKVFIPGPATSILVLMDIKLMGVNTKLLLGDFLFDQGMFGLAFCLKKTI